MSLLSYLLQSVNGVNGRITMAYVIGFMLALGPFDHVIDTTLHIVFGMLFGAGIGYGALATTVAVVTAGNLVGEIGLVTFTHVAQVRGAQQSDG